MKNKDIHCILRLISSKGLERESKLMKIFFASKILKFLVLILNKQESSNTKRKLLHNP